MLSARAGPNMSSSLNRELVFLILQFLDEEKFRGTLHKLEQESALFFNMRYFEESVTKGEWDAVDKYLAGFTKFDDNRHSLKAFFEIRKQKYLEALDKRDRVKALEILVTDLKEFARFNEDVFVEMTQLLTLDNFRENPKLSKYGDAKSARASMLTELKKLIEANPLLRDKLQSPSMKNSRLRTLINQGLNWQHQLCKNPRPSPEIKTLFSDHSCGQSHGIRAASHVTNPLMGSIPKSGGFPPSGTVGPFQPSPASLAGWIANAPPMAHPVVSAGAIGLNPPNNAEILNYKTRDSEYVLKRAGPFGTAEEVNLPVKITPLPYPTQSHALSLHSSEDLPRTVVMVLNQGSFVKSMDFHPLQQVLLLIGTNVGDVLLWDVSFQERLALKSFKVWKITSCSMPLQASLANDYSASINRVAWSPDGALFGVAYSRNIIHLYSYNGGDDLRNHLEIEAHAGSVNDIAFSYPNELCVVTCGEDRLIKVWDAATGIKQFSFEGHGSPVYSIRPSQKENIQFIISMEMDGKIMAWLYDNAGSRVDYDAPGRSPATMAYSADGTRLFSCGSNKRGESFLVEWNDSEGAVKRTYHGLGKGSVGMVQFDTTKNRFLAAGDEFLIKFWDMDNVNILATTDVDGGIPASPCIRFNKDGKLLAVSTIENGVKILANTDGLRFLQTFEKRFSDPSRAASKPILKNLDNRSIIKVNPRIVDEPGDKSRVWMLTEINEPSECRTLKLPDNLSSTKVCRLIYTNSGHSILALASNALHKLWKWQRNNPPRQATTSSTPLLWQPSSGILMTNDVGDLSPEDGIPCFALSKNDSYVLSASGGRISLFNMMTFKTMITFMPPPPTATFLAFHPQDNNIIAVGLDDSTILIYNVRVEEEKSKLRGHQKHITGLAFSLVLDILASSGADSQIFIWSMEGWARQSSRPVQILNGKGGDTSLQFHRDQIHLLAIHETQIVLYEAPKLKFCKQWAPPESSVRITDATFSCDSQSIYVSFDDGSVGMVTASTFTLRCFINKNAYLPPNPSLRVYPVVIAAHPFENNQFAVGLSDGGVYVVEPLESVGKWGNSPPIENVAGSTFASSPGPTVSDPRSLSRVEGVAREFGMSVDLTCSCKSYRQSTN